MNFCKTGHLHEFDHQGFCFTCKYTNKIMKDVLARHGYADAVEHYIDNKINKNKICWHIADEEIICEEFLRCIYCELALHRDYMTGYNFGKASVLCLLLEQKADL